METVAFSELGESAERRNGRDAASLLVQITPSKTSPMKIIMSTVLRDRLQVSVVV